MVVKVGMVEVEGIVGMGQKVGKMRIVEVTEIVEKVLKVGMVGINARLNSKHRKGLAEASH